MRTEAELNAIRRRVVNVVGHALRTPVTTLCGMADELARRADDPEARAVLADGVHRNARIVEQLLDDLLVASDVGTALPVAEPAHVDLAARARDVWDGYGDARPLEITGSGQAHVAPPIAEGALGKLLDNAHLYSDGAVAVAVSSERGRVVAEIASVGGLPSEAEIPLITEAFFRGEHAVMRSPGLGIGLTVAVALARHAGGDVTVAISGDRFIATLELPS